MRKDPKYYIVEASALPEVFIKVAEAKRLLSTGEAATVNEATRLTGISRSAFYKYRDAVLPFQNMMTGRIITFQFLIHDRKGLLASLLSVFADHKANIQTVNSIVPTNGSAVVTISAETIDLEIPIEELLQNIWRAPFSNYREVPMSANLCSWEQDAEGNLLPLSNGLADVAGNTVTVTLQLSTGEKLTAYQGALKP